MCAGAIENSGASVSVSTTGIAGPSGGTEEKPVGVVFIGCCVENKTKVREFRFSGSRQDIRVQTVAVAFEMIRQRLSGAEGDAISCQYGATYT
jgi:PncC family amidohydrolase